jgi:hypothetical protein
MAHLPPQEDPPALKFEYSNISGFEYSKYSNLRIFKSGFGPGIGFEFEFEYSKVQEEESELQKRGGGFEVSRPEERGRGEGRFKPHFTRDYPISLWIAPSPLLSYRRERCEC